MKKTSYREMTGPYGLLAERAAFHGNSMRAEWVSFRPSGGRLDDAEFDRLVADWNRAVDLGVLMYVVWSYNTPIAWAIGNEPAYCVDQRFSVTTSKGQGYVRAWIDHNASGHGYAAYRAERERLGL